MLKNFKKDLQFLEQEKKSLFEKMQKVDAISKLAIEKEIKEKDALQKN